jgi:hypothetical protein
VSPDGYRNEGTPSLSEGPDARGETFWFLLGRLPKGTRRKGETISGRYRRNGYVPDQPTDWSADRPPSRASSLPHSKLVRQQKPGRFPTMKPAFSPLPQRHSRLTSTKRKICPNPPQVEGPNNRHSTNSANSANSPNDSISAKLQAKPHVIDCPFDCHHRIANTHGNLTLPARNKE